MSFVAGLIALPIGMLVMAAKGVLQVLLDYPMWDLVVQTLKTELFLAGFFLAPITLIGLPLAYWALRGLRQPWLFALTGAAVAVIAIVLELSLHKAMGGPIDSVFAPLANLNFMAPRLVGAAAAAFAFACLMQRWRPSAA